MIVLLKMHPQAAHCLRDLRLRSVPAICTTIQHDPALCPLPCSHVCKGRLALESVLR